MFKFKWLSGAIIFSVLLIGCDHSFHPGDGYTDVDTVVNMDSDTNMDSGVATGAQDTGTAAEDTGSGIKDTGTAVEDTDTGKDNCSGVDMDTLANVETVVYDCGLPHVGGEGQPRPNGTTGGLQVLDWAGYAAAVTYSFDDGMSSQKSEWDMLMGLDVNFTFYLVTDWDYTSSNWLDAQQLGHEIGNHTATHDCSTIESAHNALESVYGPIYTMAAPYGDTASCQSAAQSLYIIDRSVSGGVIMPNDGRDPFHLPAWPPPEDADESRLTAYVDSARRDGGWATFCIHGFSDYNDGAYHPISAEGFEASVNKIKGYGDVWIDSMVNVGSYWLAQKGATATDTRLTWTLPDNYPAGKCLRISVEGGDVYQDCKKVEWNEHGYYEISLDGGDVTVRAATDTRTGALASLN